MNTNNTLPAHLERIGDQLIAAAESLYATGPEESRGWVRPRGAFARLAQARRPALAGGIASLAAAVSVVAVLATAEAPPAYALTQNANGTYTITINDIATGVPALNAKLKQLGINATAVPVTTTCTAPNDDASLIMRATLDKANVSGGTQGVINLDTANIPAGSQHVVAAYQSPSGQIDLTIATMTGSIPSCLNASDVSTATASNPTTYNRQ